MSVAQTFVRFALSTGALELFPAGKERKLKSGRMSPYFFNSGLFKTGRSITELAAAYAAVAVTTEVEVLFGPAYKGIPLVTATAMSMWIHHGRDVDYSFNRKEAKDHGEEGELVGASIKDKRVLYIDDVMTTGGTADDTIRLIQKYAGRPIGCVIGFDRQEHGASDVSSAVEEFSHRHNIPVQAAATLEDLIEVLELSTNDQEKEVLSRILAYRKQYGNVIQP